MTSTLSKLEKVHANLWSLYYPRSISSKIYLAIFIYEFFWKTWILYLQNKNKFVNIFQTWLLDIEVKSEYLMKTLRVNKDSKFILIKVKAYYQ